MSFNISVHKSTQMTDNNGAQDDKPSQEINNESFKSIKSNGRNKYYRLLCKNLL